MEGVGGRKAMDIDRALILLEALHSNSALVPE